MRALSAAASAVIVGACTVTGALGGLTSSGGGTTVRDLAYMDGPRGHLDVYSPKPAARPAPVIVFLYGGTWQMGDKAVYRFVGKALASRGYVVVIPDYRVYPEVKYPDFLRDNAKAVRWAHTHAGAYGGDPGRLFLMGHSAGAYNMAMLTLDERWLAAEGLDARRDIKAAVGISGPYDFLPLQDDTLKIIFGPEAERPMTQPVAYVDGKEAPMLLLHGLKDTTVEPANATRLERRIRAKGGEVEVKFYKGLSHTMAVGAFAGPLRGMAPVLDDSVAFIARHGGDVN